MKTNLEPRRRAGGAAERILTLPPERRSVTGLNHRFVVEGFLGWQPFYGSDVQSRLQAGAPLRGRSQDTPGAAAFSLLEVMVALAIFFASAFAILSLVAGGLANARRLERPPVDAAAVASIYSLTNKIVESTQSGDLGDMLGDDYRGYTWESNSEEVESNKLFRVDFTIYSPAPGHPVFSQISTLFFRPQSPAGSMDRGLGFH